jgi:hypothetical protein
MASSLYCECRPQPRFGQEGGGGGVGGWVGSYANELTCFLGAPLAPLARVGAAFRLGGGAFTAKPPPPSELNVTLKVLRNAVSL